MVDPKSRLSPKASLPPTAPDLSIRGDAVSLHPAGYTADEAAAALAKKSRSSPAHGRTGDSTGLASSDSDTDVTTERNLVEGMARFRSSPLDFLREVGLHVSGTGWRSYDEVVGQPVFYTGFSEKMHNRVMGSELLRRKINQLAAARVGVELREGGLMGLDSPKDSQGRTKDERVKKTEKKIVEKRRSEIQRQLIEVADGLVDDMICKMEGKRFIRGAYYMCTQLLTRAYHQGIHVSSEEVLRLRTVAEKAQRDKQSIIFLPCHRSHVDYVSLQVICFRLGLGLPTVVAGDNLNFPLVGSFLQHAGAMWIRRSFGDDQLYTTVVQAYIDTLLNNGFNFECFVEGGRSRTGKLLPPKFGILGFIIDSILSGRVNDAIICPVSTQYDKVIEVDSYINELLGRPKPKENLKDFLSSSSVLSLKLGRVDVRFHEPWSLRGFINEQKERYSRLPQQLDDKETRLRLLRTMGYKVLSDINDVSVVMPTALIGTVLLTLRGRGVGKAELIRRVDWLCDRVRARGGRVAHFAGLPTSVVVERGLEVLGPNLVSVVDEGLAEETYYAVDRFQLSFYRNMTIHLFVLEALVSAGMYMRIKQGGGPENQRISYKDLKDQVYFLSQLFRGEFIFPTQGFEVNLEKTIGLLEKDDVIKVTCSSQTPTQIDFVELSDAERESGRENYDFYCFLIWPFIEAGWLGSVSLLMLTPPLGSQEHIWLDMKKVQAAAQQLGKTLYHQGDLSYFEAVNKEILGKNYQHFEEEGIIIVSKGRGAAVIRLADDWMPTRDAETGKLVALGKVWDFAEQISHSRREGKNRRDGATVHHRVLSLADKVGQQLFEETAAAEAAGGAHLKGPNAEEQAVLEGKRKKRRRKSSGPGVRARL